MQASVFVPGSIGNVGPGFDVLGLAIDGIGDRVSIELTGHEWSVHVGGRDADRVPSDPAKNVAAIAARHYLESKGYRGGATLWLEKGLPLSGGMGGSAASSVGGAVAAARALGGSHTRDEIIDAALAGESVVAGRHLDNIAPSLLGGLCVVVETDPVTIVKIPMARDWWIVLMTPEVRIETKFARSVMPATVERAVAVQQMAATCGVMAAFEHGDEELLRRSLVDRFAEPYRAILIPNFFEVQRAAIDNGAMGCTISGSGPTMFAVVPDENTARHVAEAMRRAFTPTKSEAHVARIAKEGARES